MISWENKKETMDHGCFCRTNLSAWKIYHILAFHSFKNRDPVVPRARLNEPRTNKKSSIGKVNAQSESGMASHHGTHQQHCGEAPRRWPLWQRDSTLNEEILSRRAVWRLSSPGLRVPVFTRNSPTHHHINTCLEKKTTLINLFVDKFWDGPASTATTVTTTPTRHLDMTISSGSTKYLQKDEDPENRTLRDSRELDLNVKSYSRLVRVKEHLWADVDPERSSLPLACYCFMTGFMCVILIFGKKWSILLTLSLATLSLSLRYQSGVGFRRFVYLQPAPIL